MASSSSTGDTGAGGSGGSGGMSVEDQMRDEIARLTATINQHKSGQSTKPPSFGYHATSGYGYYGGYRGRGRGRGGAIMNGSGGGGSGGPHKQYVRPGLVTANSAASGKGKENASVDTAEAVVSMSADGNGSSEGKTKNSVGRKEVIIGGVAFEASKRSLVRKDLAATKPKTKKATAQSFTRKGPHGHLMPHSRMYKPKGRNMTLDNTGRSYSHSRSKKAAIRKIDKPCSKFTKTGTCSRGLTCPYQHDPTKIAICWNFMQGNCPKTADTCNLSHNPTPERTPLCVHFLNRGRCTKENCLFPHVNVGKKEGVCKDFAVLGYCEKGVGCDKNHVRECPEFEETGECRTRGCKLPHVIKANARWVKKDKAAEEKKIDGGGGEKVLTAESGQLGDEYISLIFNESEESESSGESSLSSSSDGEEMEEEGETGSEGEMEVHG